MFEPIATCVHLADICRVDLTPPHIVVTYSPLAQVSIVNYDGAECLPEWMQRKLAVLMTLNPDKVNAELPGVGRRISQYVYWIRRSPGETIGTHTREESKAPRSESP